MSDPKILTEEELQTLETINNFGNLGYEAISAVIASHRILFSANAELSFSNMLLKAAYNKLLKETNSCKTP